MKTDVCEQFAQKGHRRTQVRHLLHELLGEAKQPLSVPDLQDKFKRKKIPVNKTTLYREIDFYTSQNLINEIQLGEPFKRYELAVDHHHHFVCQKCKKIMDLKLTQNLSKEMNRISKKYKVTINQHSLEFFGLCATCR
ncbi:MAG: Fur family transcriptional regulator [Patescibacteria group bacterium]